MPPLSVAVSPPVAQLGRTTSLTISLWQQTGLGAGFPAFVFRPWQAGCGWLWPSELDPCSVSLSDQSDFKKPADDASPAPHRYQPVRSGQRRPWSPAFVGTASRVVLSALIALGYILGWIVSPPLAAAHSTNALVQPLPAVPAQPLSSSFCLVISKWAILSVSCGQ